MAYGSAYATETLMLRFEKKKSDSEGIRTLAGRAQWISSPSP